MEFDWYLTYLRDRLTVARDLLNETGSIFVQISDENLHRVRALMDELFGEQNFAALIYFLKTTGKGSRFLDPSGDYVVWYAKNAEVSKVRPLFTFRSPEDFLKNNTIWLRLKAAHTDDWQRTSYEIPRPFLTQISGLCLQAFILTVVDKQPSFVYQHNGDRLEALRGYFWRTTQGGLDRLNKASRLCVLGKVHKVSNVCRRLPDGACD